MRKLILVGFALLIQGVSLAQLHEVKRITKTLCSPEFHGRGYVNRGDSIAGAFIADEFQQLGLKKRKGSYFQEFSHPVNTFPGKMEVKCANRPLKVGVDFIVDAASAGGNITLNPKRVPASLALNSEEFGRILQSIGDGYNSIALDFTGLSADTLKKLRGVSQEVANFLPVIELTDAKFTWSVADQQFIYPLIYLKPGIWKEGDELLINIDAELKKNYVSNNVIAFLPAKGCTKKTIVYTAHYDHLGRMGTETYFPGANDNASGTAMLLSMAAYFKENRPKYNVLFIAFAGEEAGLLGSNYFVENPTYKLKNMSFLLNLDIMGSGEEGVTVVNATLFEKEFSLLQQINAEKNLLTQIKSRGPAANSDHYWFTEKGVPAFFIYTMGPNKHYHDVFDTFEELSFVEYEDITTLLVEFGNRFFTH